MGTVTRLRCKGRLRKFDFFFLEADDVGVFQSFELFFDVILIGYRVRGYRCRVVDANVDRCIPTRRCSGGKGPDSTRFTEFGRGM